MKETRERNTEHPSPKPSNLPQCPIQPFLPAYLSPYSPSPRCPAPLVIAILPFVIISFLTPFPYFLALISSSSPAILLLSFHTRLLYYTRAMRTDKNVTALCSIYQVEYGAWYLLSSSASFYFLTFSLSLRLSLAQYYTICIFHYRRISNNWTIYYVVGVASSGKVCCFFGFFMTPRGAEQLFFCRDFHPFSQVGNSRLHSTLFNYSRFYGTVFKCSDSV